MTVVIEGKLDSLTAPILESEIAMSIPDIKELIVDFKGLKSLSSAGLRILLTTQKVMKKQGKMTIKNVSFPIMEIFDLTGFSSIFNIEKPLPAANIGRHKFR